MVEEPAHRSQYERVSDEEMAATDELLKEGITYDFVD